MKSKIKQPYEAPAIICPECKRPLTKEVIGPGGRCIGCISKQKA